jgi:hypothetical protein
MGWPRRRLIVFSLLVGLACPAQAEEKKPGQINSKDTARKVLTGKERLGPKWTDEQRIDNCNVPVDKRGTRPRPSACTNAPPS